jgi:(2Fe-2S) ferredoxin
MIRTLRSEWRGAVIVCRKCSKKAGGGFGPKGRTPLPKLLRKTLRLKRGRKAPLGIVETGCLKVCPKRAVTVVAASGEWLVVPVGADADEIVAALHLEGVQPA